MTFLIDMSGSSVPVKQGAFSVFKNSSRLAVKPSPEGPLMLDETSGANAGAVITRRPGIKSSPFGIVKRSSAPRHISPTSLWVARSGV